MYVRIYRCRERVIGLPSAIVYRCCFNIERHRVISTVRCSFPRAVHAAQACRKDPRRLRRYIIQRKGVLPIRNSVRVRGERRREGVVGFCRKLLVKLGVRRRTRRHLRGLQ